MVKKYFVVSDIHSFYSSLKLSLERAGFDKDNPSHYLIVCGDVFDRGPGTIKVYNFLKSMPKERCILIRGNHEFLYLDLLEKNYPEEHDFSNGTVKSFCQIAGFEDDSVWDLETGFFTFLTGKTVMPDYQELWDTVKRKVKESPVTEWLKSDRWINFYEIDKYIFVHSFIPLEHSCRSDFDAKYMLYSGWTEFFSYREDWRQASLEEWENASWTRPYSFFDKGFLDKEKEKGKILVCGHRSTSEYNLLYKGEKNNFDIYEGDGLIAIDGTVAFSSQLNVFTFEVDE